MAGSTSQRVFCSGCGSGPAPITSFCSSCGARLVAPQHLIQTGGQFQPAPAAPSPDPALAQAPSPAPTTGRPAAGAGGTWRLHARFPPLAWLYVVGRPTLVLHNGQQRPLRWGQNSVETDLLAQGIEVFVSYFGMRVGRASFRGTPRGGALRYCPPWVVGLSGEIGVEARHRGLGVLLVLLAVLVVLPFVLAVAVVLSAVSSVQSAPASPGVIALELDGSQDPGPSGFGR